VLASAGPRVATVVLNYREPSDTLRAVASVRRSTVLDQRLVVVDNAEDGPEHRALADALGQGVEVLATGGNLGYAGGNNVGLRHALDGAAPEFLWVLNPDAEVEPTTLERLLEAAEQVPDAAVVGGRILHDAAPAGEGRIWFDGGLVDDARWGATSHLHSGRAERSVPAGDPRDTGYVTGACMLVRRRALLQVGLIPEEWFLYFEETDLCRRLQALGWRTVVAPRARLVHRKRSSGALPTPYYVYYITRNRLRFAQEWYGTGRSGPQHDAVLADWRAAFLDPWRDRVAERAPHWLATYDHLVATAVHDAQEGVTGRRPDIEEVPRP
jgi:hypothetical protein